MTLSILQRLRALEEAGANSEVIRILDELEKNGAELTSDQLVLKGRCILRSDETQGFEPSDAECAFKEAIRANPQCVEALLELGWYYFYVDDDAGRAQPLFEQVLTICRASATISCIGIAKCVAELKSKKECLAYLLSFPSLLDDSKISAALASEFWPDD